MANRTLEFLITAKETATPVVNRVTEKFRELERAQQAKVSAATDTAQAALVDKQLRMSGEHLRADLIQHQEYFDKRIIMAQSAGEREALAQIESLERVEMIRKAQLEADEAGFAQYQAFKKEMLAQEVVATEVAVAEEVAIRKAGDAEMGGLQSVRETFGRGSAFGMTAMMLKGAGPLMGISAAAMLIKDLAQGFEKMSKDSQDINKNWADLTQDFIHAIPVLNQIADAGESINNILTHNKDYRDQIDKDAKAVEDRINAQNEGHKLGMDQLGKMNQLAGGAMMDRIRAEHPEMFTDPHQGVRSEFANKQAELTKTRNDAMAQMASVPMEARDKIWAKRVDEIDQSFERASEDLARGRGAKDQAVSRKILGGIMDGIVSAATGAGSSLSESAKKFVSGAAGPAGGLFGMLSSMASGSKPAGQALISSALPGFSDTGLSGAAQAAREQLDLQRFNQQRERDQTEKAHTDAMKKHGIDMKYFADSLKEFNFKNAFGSALPALFAPH